MDDMYREVILDHYKNPRNTGTLDPHDFTFEDENPLCGDKLRIDVRLTNSSASARWLLAGAAALSRRPRLPC